MLHTLAFVLAMSLTPAQAGDLTLSNVRPLYDELGPVRLDDKVIPGDVYWVGFDIEGVKSNDEGRVSYSLGMDVTNSAGKVVYRQDPIPQVAVNSLGGSRLPAAARVFVGFDQEPGDYTLSVQVRDDTTKKSASLKRKFTVAPRFGIIRVSPALAMSPKIPAPTIAVAGQIVYLNFALAGFKRGGKGEQPNIGVEVQVVDEDGQPTLKKPLSTTIKQVEKDAVLIPTSAVIALNRPGKFKIRMRATDELAGEKAEVSYPLTVLEPK